MAIEAELQLPPSRGPVNLIGFAIWYGLIGAVAGLAIYNLIHVNSRSLATTIASLIVMAFIPSMAVHVIRDEGGLKQYLVNRLGELCSTRFLSIEHDQDGVQKVCLGYRLRSRRFYFRKVPIADVISVTWHSGQGTELAGREMNDWHTCLFHLTNRTNTVSRMSAYISGRLEDVISFGPYGAKEQVERFAPSVIEFLSKHGVTLVPSNRAREFVNPNLDQSKIRSAGV